MQRVGTSRFVGTIPEIVRNDESLYEGDLKHYFRILFNHARNLNGPYHNFRHMFHVMWLCYDACRFYADRLTKREMRDLLIAALFHDFDHIGRTGNDDLNIALALRGLKKYIAPEDQLFLADIVELVRPTEYPYKITAETLSLSQKILRDADISQAFSVAWIQQVVFGLAAEMSSTPRALLGMQEAFIRGTVFNTEWAEKKFAKEKDSKIEEARGLIALLEE